MMLGNVNYIAVLVSALAAFFVGWFWYSPNVFGKTWLKLMGWNDKKAKEMQEKEVLLLPALFLRLLEVEKRGLVFEIFNRSKDNLIGGRKQQFGLFVDCCITVLSFCPFGDDFFVVFSLRGVGGSSHDVIPGL